LAYPEGLRVRWLVHNGGASQQEAPRPTIREAGYERTRSGTAGTGSSAQDKPGYAQGGQGSRETDRGAGQGSNEVKRRIERGDVQPRPLPGLREDSMASMESMESMPSMKSIESADYATEVSEEAQQVAEAGGVMMEDMPLEGQPIDPELAHEDLAQRVTEETGSGGDPHLHAERKADELSKEMTEDTGAGGGHATACRSQSGADERGDVRRVRASSLHGGAWGT
jgi:hypothetical protein